MKPVANLLPIRVGANVTRYSVGCRDHFLTFLGAEDVGIRTVPSNSCGQGASNASNVFRHLNLSVLDGDRFLLIIVSARQAVGHPVVEGNSILPFAIVVAKVNGFHVVFAYGFPPFFRDLLYACLHLRGDGVAGDSWHDARGSFHVRDCFLLKFSIAVGMVSPTLVGSSYRVGCLLVFLLPGLVSFVWSPYPSFLVAGSFLPRCLKSD